MFRVEPMPMPGNNPRAGQTDGLWRVMFADLGKGGTIPEHPAQRTHAENLSYEAAAQIARELEKKLNSAD